MQLRVRFSGHSPLTVLAFALALVALLGAGLLLVLVVPAPDVVLAPEPNAPNPFSSSFIVSNNGFIALRDVSASVGVGYLRLVGFNPPRPGVPRFKGELTRPSWRHHKLSMNDEFTIDLADFFQLGKQDRLAGADIGIVISYKPWFSPFFEHKVFRFVTARQSGGALSWSSYPLTEPSPAFETSSSSN